MCVVLGKATYAGESMEYSAAFEAVHRAPLCKSHGKVAIGSDAMLVDVDVKRTIHRFQVIELLFDLDRGVHVLGVKIQMAAGLPKICAPDVRGIDKVVTRFKVFLLAVVFDNMPDQAAFRMP